MILSLCILAGLPASAYWHSPVSAAERSASFSLLDENGHCENSSIGPLADSVDSFELMTRPPRLKSRQTGVDAVRYLYSGT